MDGLQKNSPTSDDLGPTNESRGLQVRREVAGLLDVPLLDLTPDLMPQGKALYLDADPVHLNAQGNLFVADRVFNSLTNHLSP